MILNPVIERELKTKMRKWRAPALLAVYLFVLGLVVFSTFKTREMSSLYDFNFFPPLIAVECYSTIAIMQLLMILFIVPSLTSSAISAEREQQTLDLMLSTNFSPYKIVFGKLVVSISHILMLLVASLPFLSITLIYGGIGLTDLLKLMGFFVMTAIMAGSIGIFYSTILKRSRVASIATYITLIGIVIGSIVAYGYYTSYIATANPYGISGPYGSAGSMEPTPKMLNLLLFSNPFYGLMTLLPNSMGGSIIPFTNFDMQMFDRYNMSIFLRPFAVNMYFDIGVSIILYIITVGRLKPIKRRLFKRKKKLSSLNRVVSNGL